MTLHIGDLVRLSPTHPAVYRVALVNACRARLDLTRKGDRKRESFETAEGEVVVFEKPEGERMVSVSPSAFLEPYREEEEEP